MQQSIFLSDHSRSMLQTMHANRLVALTVQAFGLAGVAQQQQQQQQTRTASMR
jgi:hypothetical protein